MGYPLSRSARYLRTVMGAREAEPLADLERALPAFMQELNVFQLFRSNHLGFPLLEETLILPVSTSSYRHVL